MVLQLLRNALAIATTVGLTLAATACEGEGPAPESPADVTAADPARPAPSANPLMPAPEDDPAAHARSVCEEGSLAECQVACDSGQPYSCLLLARMAHFGARTAKDPALGDAIARGACNAGALEACAQLALWRSDTDASDAAALALRACEAPDAATARIGCGVWMHALEHGTYAPADADLVPGLTLVCRREQAGVVEAGAPLGASMQPFEYVGGACGRLKDLGMRPGEGRP